jgi:hypothetical protein
VFAADLSYFVGLVANDMINQLMGLLVLLVVVVVARDSLR